MTTIIKIIEKQLIGKSIRVCTYHVAVIQPHNVWIKKSFNVTDKQFESGELKYRMLSNKNRIIGSHKKFENLKIKSIEFSGSDDHVDVVLRLENGSSMAFDINEEINFI